MKTLPINLLLPEAFFKSEIKCDYCISEKQKRIWAIELDLIIQFDKICKKYNIDYSLFAGTMLGAIRHKGFIPWDDDVDVCMNRKNFEKLLKVPEEEFKHPYFLQTPYNDTKYFCPFIRFRNSETTGIIKGNESLDYNNGIYIDVFVLDGKPKLLLFQYFHNFLLKLIVRFIMSYNYDERLLQRQLHGLKKLRYMFLRKIARSIRYNIWVYLYEKTSGMFNKTGEQLCLITHGYDNRFMKKYWVTKDELKSISNVDFEGYKLPVIKDFDLVLKRIYNDYMSFPPIEQRGTWHMGIIEFDPDIPYKEYLKNIEPTKI